MVHLTVRDYESLPEDGNRYEILDGRLEVTPAPSYSHQRAGMKLTRRLQDHAETRALGTVIIAPFDVVLAVDAIAQPDVLYISNARRSILSEKRVNGAPDLVVEIFHHASALRDTEVKRQLYARYGVSEYWQIDLDLKRILVLELTDAGYEEYSRAEATGKGAARSRLLPDFTVDWTDLFEVE